MRRGDRGRRRRMVEEWIDEGKRDGGRRKAGIREKREKKDEISDGNEAVKMEECMKKGWRRGGSGKKEKRKMEEELMEGWMIEES